MVNKTLLKLFSNLAIVWYANARFGMLSFRYVCKGDIPRLRYTTPYLFSLHYHAITHIRHLSDFPTIEEVEYVSRWHLQSTRSITPAVKIDKNMRPNKAPRKNGIQKVTVKSLPFKMKIHYIYQEYLLQQYFSVHCKNTIVTPIRRLGKEPKNPVSYAGLYRYFQP